MPKKSTIDTERQLMEALNRIVNDAPDLVAGITWHADIPTNLVPFGFRIQGDKHAWSIERIAAGVGFEEKDASLEWFKRRNKESKERAEPALVELAVAAEAVAALMRRLRQDVQDREILA
jgi:hypothetical protein